MDDSGLRESRVNCATSQGLPVQGTIIQLGQHEVVFEVFSPGAVIQVSEVLREFKVQLGERLAYTGRAVVKNVVHTGMKMVCAVALDEAWSLQFSDADLEPGRMRTLFKEHLHQWHKLYLIRPEYKLQIADMETFFAELRVWLDQVELGLRAAAPKKGEEFLNDVAEEIGASVLPAVDALFDKFEHIAKAVEPSASPVHRAYMQRRLHPLLMGAPFPHRTFTKPLGYAGDYEMVGMIARNRPEGASLYAKVVHLCFVRQPPAVAHRNRLSYLTQRLVEETARLASEGRPMRVFCLACGPAVEIQDFLRTQEASNRTEFTLLDFNEETIQHVTAVFRDLKRQFSRRTPVQFIQRSVHQLIKEASRSRDPSKARPNPNDGQHDFVYCAGLFDYLTDAVCQRLMTLLYDWVSPGGVLLATNVAPFNPVQVGTEHLLDWHLICRKGPALQALRPTQVTPEDFQIRSDMTGVNLFMEARKPQHG